MKKGIIALAVCALLTAEAKAQSDADALRFSMLNYGSTARSLAMGNSFGALGADFSTLAINPAGIGLFRRSEVSISTQFSNRNVLSTFNKDEESDNYFKLAFGNLGIVLAKSEKGAGRGWKGFAFGFGYNKTNDFSTHYTAQTGNGKNSLLDSYLEDLNDVAPEDIPAYYPYDVDLAWETYLIDTVTYNGDLYYYSALPYAGALQRRSIETRGGTGEWDISFGGNYNDQLYFGFTMGISNLRYVEESTWEEIDDQDTIPYFKNYTYSTNLKTEGAGLNLKAGVIYRPADFFRLGLAIHSPTWYSLTDTYSASMEADLEDGIENRWDGPEYIPFDYSITTPFRAIGSMAFVFAKQGAFNVDYEFVNYNQARTRSTDDSFKSYFNTVNKAIRSKYTMSHNVRAGFEWRYEKTRFRLGGFYSTSPFKNELRDSEETDMTRFGFTGGIGYRTDKFYFDAGYAWSQMGSYVIPYTLSYQDTYGITQKQTDNRIMFTAGWLF
ncbi:MAG: hypothetical protein U0Y08_09285 [Bacteroidia bacterium]